MMRRREGISAVIGTLLLTGVLLALGMATAGQVGSARRTLGRVEIRRMLDVAAENAFEEACARIEAKPPTAQSARPMTMRLQLAASVEAGKVEGVRVGVLRATTSRLIPMGGSSAAGVIELSARVALAAGEMARTVTVRRQFQVKVSGGTLKVKISDRNLFREVHEG